MILKKSLFMLIPLFIMGCGTNVEAPDDEEDDRPAGNTTEVSFDPDAPILETSEVDWVEVTVPDPTIYTTDSSLFYRLTLEPEQVEMLANSVIKRNENGEWIDVTPESKNPNFEYHTLDEEADNMGLNASLIGFDYDPEVDGEIQHEIGEYRAIEIFTRVDTNETVQIAIPFEVVEEIIPGEMDNPDFIDVEIDDEELPTSAEKLTFAVFNYHSDYELLGGEYYRLEIQTDDTWEDITPNVDFQDIGYTIEPGAYHDFEHGLLGLDQDELEVGNYRIRKEFYLITGEEEIISDDAEVVEVVVNFEVMDE